jgi:pre-mRNA-splicing helicase BRR2
MEIAPMLVQAMLPAAAPLLQLPHFDAERCEQASALGVEDVVDVLSMEDADRNQLLQGLSESQVADVARACNMFPSIGLSVEKEGDACVVTLEREGDLVLDKRGLFVPVFAPLFPKQKEEGWWLVLGSSSSGEIEDLKRVTISQQTERVIVRPTSEGPHKLFLMSDSFVGCDQEEDL